jgi:ATP-binding cassette, subfamily B, bacterial MsbA
VPQNWGGIMRFMSTFGRLPRTWQAMALIVVAGSAEGFGMALFVPLLEILSKTGTDQLSWPFNRINDAFAYFNVPVTLYTMLGTVIFLIMSSLALAYLQRRMIIRLRHGFARSTREKYASALFRAGWWHISEKSHGEAVNEFVPECNRGSLSLQYELLALGNIIQILIYLLVSMAISWQLTLVTLGFCGFVFFIVRPFQLRAKAIGSETTEVYRNLSFYIVDFLKAAKLIKSTASEGVVLNHLNGHIGSFYDATYRSELNAIQIYFLVQALPVVLLGALIVLAHGVLGLGTSMTLVFLLILARIAPRLAQFQQYHQGYNVASPGLQIVEKMIVEAEAQAEDMRIEGYKFARLADGISIEDVTYRYPTRDIPALRSISLHIPRGKMTALVGQSGGGKSTVIDVIAGLRTPDEGRICVDGNDLGEIDLNSWRNAIGYVTQDVNVFNDTLRHNVAFTCPEASDAQILECLNSVCLDDLVSQLPNGLDTVLGEEGARLSGGQRQRLALARAIIGRPEVLLLDEATSSLDNESERLVQQAIEQIAADFTVVVVAHRLSTVRRADTIHVLVDGGIVEFGGYDELMSKGGSFAELHQQQFA